MEPYEPTHDEIAQKAYLYWENAGRPEGEDQEFWFKAKKALCLAYEVRQILNIFHENFPIGETFNGPIVGMSFSFDSISEEPQFSFDALPEEPQNHDWHQEGF